MLKKDKLQKDNIFTAGLIGKDLNYVTENNNIKVSNKKLVNTKSNTEISNLLGFKKNLFK